MLENDNLFALQDKKGQMTIGNNQVDAVVCYSPTFNSYVRFGTHDIQIAKEVRRDYPLTLKDKIVFDVGAHIGLFSRYALLRGAKQVVSIEPDPGNISMFLLNAPGAKLFEGAVGFNTLYTNHDGLNSGTFSVFGDNNTPTITVKKYNWYNLLDEVRPNVIKIDVEGAEYSFLNGTKLPNIEEVAVEIHLHRYDWRERAKYLVNSFKNWKTVVEPNLTNKWQTIGVWKR
jgi:FkbM family methyltransferase